MNQNSLYKIKIHTDINNSKQIKRKKLYLRALLINVEEMMELENY